MSTLLGLIFEMILEFRFTRWLVLGGLALAVVVTGGLFTAGGLGTLALCAFLLGLFEFFDWIGRRNGK